MKLKSQLLFMSIFIFIFVMVGCDGNECDPNCEGFACAFGCVGPRDRDRPPESPITNSLDCPSTDFIAMEVRELCNEDMCVSMDDYIECEQVDCYTVECNDTGDNK